MTDVEISPRTGRPKERPRGRPFTSDDVRRRAGAPAAAEARRKAKRKFTVADRGLFPIMRALVAEQDRQCLSDHVVAKRVGNSQATVTRWRTDGLSPRLHDFLAYAEVLGFEVVLVPKGERR